MTATLDRFGHASPLDGDKLYQRRARAALPLLVRQAKAEQPVFYSDLARELGMPNPRNLNYVLGAIGKALLELGTAWAEEIPPLQALVINRATGMPGEGVAWYAPDAREFSTASSVRRRHMVQVMLGKVYHYPHWDRVLTALGLTTAPHVWRPPVPSRAEARVHPEHQRLKAYIAQHPEVLGLSTALPPGSIDYAFRSADTIDVLFAQAAEWIGVVVIPAPADMHDLERGLYQCIKYHALIEATQRILQRPIRARVLLAIAGSFPSDLTGLKNVLGVDVIDHIRLPE